jgi:hypothetical protein
MWEVDRSVYQSIEWPPIAFSSSHNSQLSKASSNEAGSPPGTGGYETCARPVIYFPGNLAVREQVRKLILPWLIMILAWSLLSA